MSNRKSKKSQKLGSSRHRNRNRDTEERSNDGFPQTGNEDLESNQKEFHAASEDQSADASLLLHSPQAATAITSQQTSELHPHSQSQDYKDLLGQDKAVSKRRKMGSTRKSNREFKGGGIPEEEPEDKVEVSEGISQDHEMTVKEEGSKEEYEPQSPSDFSSSPSTKPESSTFEMQHAAFGSTVHVEEAFGTDGCQDLEIMFQIQPMPMVPSSCELETPLSEESINHSSNVGVVTPTESKLPLHESDDFSAVYHQMEALAKTTGQNKRDDSADRPLNENWNEENKESQNPCPAESFSGIPECTVMSTNESTLNFTGDDKQEREGTILSHACSTEAKGEGTEVQSTSFINECEQEYPSSPEELLSSWVVTEGTEEDTHTWQKASTKTKTEDKDISDHCWEHDDETIKASGKWKYIQVSKSSEYREGNEEYTEIHMAGYGKECEHMVKAKSPILMMEPDINMSPNQKSHKEVASLDQHHELELPCDSSDILIHYRHEQCDLSDARLLAGESKIEDYTAQTEESLKEQNSEELHMEERTEEKEAEDEEDKLLDLGSDSKGVAFKTLSEVTSETMGTDNQADSFAHNDSEEFSSELDMKSKEGAYIDPHAGSNKLPESNINQDARLYRGMSLSSSDRTMDKDNKIEDDIDEKKNQGFSEEIKSSENICGNSTLSIRKEEDSIDYAAASDETDELLKQKMGVLKRTDINTKDSFNSVSEDGVSAEKVLITDHFIELDKVSGLSFEEQLQQRGACTEKNIEEDIRDRDPDKEGAVLQGHILAKGDEAIKDNQEQTGQEYEILLCGGACEDDNTPQLSKEQFKAVDCAEVTADVTNSALETVYVLDEREDECHVIGNNSFSEAEENPIEPGSSEYPHITKLHPSYDNLNEKTENWMEDKMEKDEEIDHTSWFVTEGTEEDTHTWQNASTNTKTEDKDISDHCWEHDNETIKASGEWEYIQVLKSSEYREGNEEYTEIHMAGYVKECEEEKTENWMDDKMEKDEEIDHTRIKQDDGEFLTILLEGEENEKIQEGLIKGQILEEGEETFMQTKELKEDMETGGYAQNQSNKNGIFGSTVDQPEGGHQPDNEGDERKMIDMETTQGLDEEHSTSEGPEEQTKRKSIPVHLEHTCSLIQESTPIHDNVITDNSELGTSGKRRKMGSTRKSNRKQLREGDQKETTEELNIKEGGRRDEGDLDGYGANEDVYPILKSNISRANDGVAEESEGTTEKRNICPTDYSTSEDFISMCSDPNLHSGLSSQTSELGLIINIEPSPITEPSDSKEDVVNNTENVETGNTEPHAQSQSKKKRKFGSTRKSQGGHRPDTEGEEHKWKDVEATEGPEHRKEERQETTDQEATSDLLTEPQIAVSEEQLGVTDPHLQTEIFELKEEERDHGITGTPLAILSDLIVDQVDNVVLEEESKGEALVAMIEEHGKLEVDDENICDSASSNEQEMPPVSTEIQNDTSTSHNSAWDKSMIGELHDMESTEKMSSSQVHSSPPCGTMELLPESQDSLDIPANIENIHEAESDQTRRLSWDHSTSEGPVEQTNSESEPVHLENTFSLIHIQESKPIQDNVITDHSELGTSGQRRKMGSTRKSNRKQLHEGDQKESAEKINVKEGGRRSDNDDQNGYGAGEREETTNQRATSDLLTEPQLAVSEEPLGVTDPHLQNEIIELEEEKRDHRMIGTLSAIMSDMTVDQVNNVVLEEESKAGAQVEITEQHGKLEVDDEKICDSTSSNEQEMPPVSTEIQNDTSTSHNSTQEQSMVGEVHDMESTEKMSSSQVHSSPPCGTMELLPESQDSLDIPANIENIHEAESDQTKQLSRDHSTFEGPVEQTNSESEPVHLENTFSLIHIQESKLIHDNVITDHSELGTSGQRRKMGSTRKSNRKQLHEGAQKESTEELNIKVGGRRDEGDQDGYGANEDVYPTLRSNISSLNDGVVEEESEVTTGKRNVCPTDYSTSEDFISICSDPKMHSALSFQTTELALTINIQPSPITEPSDSKEEGVNSKENVETGNTEPHAQSQNKKKRKFGSTRKSQGGHRPDTEGAEHKWKDVEATEGPEHGKEERQETTDQEATSDLLTEPQIAVSEDQLGVTDPQLQIEMSEIKEEKRDHGIIGTPLAILSDMILDQVDNVVLEEESKAGAQVEITEQHGKLEVDDEKICDSTSSNEQEMPPVSTEIQNDTFTCHNSSSDPKVHSGLSSQTTELSLTTNIEPSPITEPSDSKADSAISKENVETGKTEPHSQSQNKKKRKFGSTRKSQNGHRPDNEGAERKWIYVEATEGPEHGEEERQETTDQAATSDLFTEPEIVESEEQLGVTDPQLQTDISELKEEERDHGMIGTLPVIMSDMSVDQVDNVVLEEESKAEVLLEITEQHGKLEADDEKICDSISSNEQAQKESTEELNIKVGGRRDEGDQDGYGANEDVYPTLRSNISSLNDGVVEEESEETTEKRNVCLADYSTSEDFISICSDPKMHSGLSSQTTELGLTIDLQPSQITEPSDSKEAENNEENVETGNTEQHAQSQNKKKRKFGSTRRSQGGHRPDSEGAEQKWKDVEATEGPEHGEEERQETTDQEATSDLLTEPQIAVSEDQLGVTDPQLQIEMSEIKEEKRDHGMIGTLPVRMSDMTYHQVDNVVLEEESEAGAQVEITEQHEKLEVDDEKICDSTSSNELEMLSVSTEIQNDASTCHNSSSDPKIHSGLSSQTTELGLSINVQPSPITEPTDSKGDGVNSKENVETGNTEPHAQSQNKKKRKFGSTRRSQGGHRPGNEGAEQKWKDFEATEQLEHRMEERQETTDQEATSDLLTEPQIAVSEDQLGVTDPHLQTETSELKEEKRDHGIIGTLPVIMSDNQVDHVVFEEESKAGALLEITEQHGQLEVDDEKICYSTSSNELEMLSVSTEIQNDASTCHNSSSDPKIHSGLSSQTTELGLSINVQPSPITEPTDSKGDGVNSNENVETGNTEPHAQREHKKKRKFGSTRRTQGGHRPDTEGEERKLEVVEVTEGLGHGEEERQETTDQAATSDLLTCSDKQKLQAVKTNIQIHTLSDNTPPLESSMVVDGHDMDTENVHASSREGKMEIVPEMHFSHDISVNTESTHEILSDQRPWDHIFQGPEEQLRNRESETEPLESSITLILIPESKATVAKVVSEHSEKRRKMGSTRKSHREPLHRGDQRDTTEEMQAKENTEEQKIDETAGLTEEANSEHEIPSVIPTFNAETSDQFIEKQFETRESTDITSESITITTLNLEKLDNKKRKMGSTRRNFKGRDGKKTREITGDMDSRAEEDITTEETTKVDTDLDDTLSEWGVISDTMRQGDKPQIHHTLDGAEGSLLSEIERELKIGCQSQLNTTAPELISERLLDNTLETCNKQENISEIPQMITEKCKGTLELPSTQSSQTCTEPSSPGRRRKFGSTRKTPRNKLAEETDDDRKEPEQETENLETGKNSDPKRETETVMLQVPEDMDDITSEVQAVSRVGKNDTVSIKQPIPEGNRKFGSRRKTNTNRNLSVLTPSESEPNQQETEDIQAVSNELLICDPYFISETESTPISQPSDNDCIKASPGDEQVGQSVASASAGAALVCLDDLRKFALYNGSSGRREMIDFEQWPEQIPDFGVAVYNVVMVGNSNVGKTSFVRRFQCGQFSQDYSSTIGVDTCVQNITLGNRTVKLNVWDTAGQERYHSLTRQVFHKAQSLLLMYDTTSSQSFYAVRNWISQIQERAPADVIVMLLGNKNDCTGRQVQLQDGEDLAREYGIHFMECSAATGENVSECVKTLAWLLVKQRVRREEEQTILQPKQPQKSGCC